MPAGAAAALLPQGLLPAGVPPAAFGRVARGAGRRPLRLVRCSGKGTQRQTNEWRGAGGGGRPPARPWSVLQRDPGGLSGVPAGAWS